MGVDRLAPVFSPIRSTTGPHATFFTAGCEKVRLLRKRPAFRRAFSCACKFGASCETELEDNYHGGVISPAMIKRTPPPTAYQLDLVAGAVEEETYAADGTGEAHVHYPVIATFRRARASAYEFDMQVT